MIDNSPNNTTTINGYKCKKDKNGEYFIGHNDRYFDSLVTISPNQKHRRKDENHILTSSISMGRLSEIPLGKIRISNIKEMNEVETIAGGSLSKEYANNTILENAMNFHYNNPQTEKEKQLSIQRVLMMLKDLEIELTPTENMEILKVEKEIESKDAKESRFEINEFGEIIRPAKQPTSEELENMSEEELQKIIENNDKTIEQNNDTLKKALVERILEQQKTISEQQQEMMKLNSQKREI